MYNNLPFLTVAADQRHSELLAEAEQFRLAKRARAARRATQTAPPPPAREPDVRPPVERPRRVRVGAAHPHC